MSEEERMGTAEGAQAMRARGRGARAFLQSEDERIQGERARDERDVAEDRELSEDERLEMLRDSLVQSMLPDLPRIPGYHVCWLTTTNKSDTIAWRKRLGYELIRAEDLPGWEGVSIKAGDYAGIVGVNELMAAKIPLSLYNRYVRELHHRMPLEQEEKLRAQMSLMKEKATEAGSYVQEGDGTANLVQRAKPMPELRE